LKKRWENLSPSEQQALNALRNLGHDIYVPLENSNKGLSGKTPDFIIGTERMDVYTPNNLKPSSIANKIENKVKEGQANSVIVVVPEGFSKFDMYKTAAASFSKTQGGKPVALDRVLFLQNEKLIQLDKKAIDSLRGKQ